MQYKRPGQLKSWNNDSSFRSDWISRLNQVECRKSSRLICSIKRIDLNTRSRQFFRCQKLHNCAWKFFLKTQGQQEFVRVMQNLSCDILVLQFFPSITEVEDLRSTYITNCVFNILLCHTAVMMNIAAIYAIKKTSCLPKTLETLLLSLAASDVGVGLLSQPFYTWLLVKGLSKAIPNCSTYMVFDAIIGMFTITSFLGVLAVSADRFLAIHLHLRYQELVTHKRVVTSVVSLWLASVSVSVIVLWLSPHVKYLIMCVGGLVGLFLTTIAYSKIYLTVRRLKNDIESGEVRQEAYNGEGANFANVLKTTVGIFYVYVVFWACYAPFFISTSSMIIYGRTTPLKGFFVWSLTLAYLNSTLNPVIYCWKMRHIRNAIMDTLRGVCSVRNQGASPQSLRAIRIESVVNNTVADKHTQCDKSLKPPAWEDRGVYVPLSLGQGGRSHIA